MSAINLFYLRNLIRHYFQATPVDVLHSPFVFDLWKNCIRRQKDPISCSIIEKLRNELKISSSQVCFNDLGAGNEVSKQKKMLVSDVAKKHAKQKILAQTIYRLIKHHNYSKGIELGTSLGLTTAYIATALSESENHLHFESIEGSEEVFKLASQNFQKLALENYVRLNYGNFDFLLEKVLQRFDQIDFAFVDGNHTYEATMNYFKQLLYKVHNNTLLIFDDIYWSDGMAKAWNEIKKNEQVTVTVDLFFIGLVYFRKEQNKQHFKLRII